VQERYGQELRLSVRGSGISRGFHLRGLEVQQDGIPFNLADGSGDFYQIDPLALRSVEVYKGGNALSFGATTLGGAVNFVTPTAHTAFAPNILRIDGGSFNTIRENFQFSRISGPVDFLINGTLTNSDGYRDHETQRTQNFNANLGYKLAPGVETRFYAGVYITDQKLPGTLTLFNTLNNPTLANPTAITGNQSRKVETERIANRTSFVLDVGKLDIDTWAIHKSLYHPIFQVIDQDGWTYGISPHWAGTFDLGGFRNDTILGLRAFAGQNSAQQYVNIRGNRGAQTLNALQSAANLEAYGENRFWFLPDVALMTGAKLFSSNRTYSNEGGFTGASQFASFANETYEGINPKLGLLWQPLSEIQIFGDVTRSRDVPDFSDLVQANILNTTFVPLQAQRAWTYEAGTRAGGSTGCPGT
jgi:iron complex outermembrane receptor protein